MGRNLLKVPIRIGEYGAPVLEALGDELVAIMKLHDAPNFLGFHMKDNEGEEWMLTIQRVSGETPEAQCNRLRARIARLEEALREARDFIMSGPTAGDEVSIVNKMSSALEGE